MANTKRVSKKVSPLSKFAKLPKGDQKRIAGVIIGSMRRLGYFGRGGYKVVHGPDQKNRAWTTAETGGEVEQLTASERNRLIALARNAARNSDKLAGILHQLELNVVGTEGGKAIFSFPEEYAEAERIVREAFASWAESAEYFDDLNLQTVLKLVLKTLLIGGDCVLVFDWDVTSKSTGQIIAFEPDCIGNLAEGDFKLAFPGYHQYQGIIKDAEGKTVGAICSWAERGQCEYQLFDKDGKRTAWTLIKPSGLKWRDSLFTIVRGLERLNQMRGSSRVWPGLGSVVDLSDLQGYELQAAKLNSQKIGQVLQQDEQNEGEIAAELDPDAVAPVDVDGAIAEAVEAAPQQRLELDEIDRAGTIYDVMPPGVKMELFDTKHPNDKLVEFSKWMHSGVAFALGLGNVHASGQADASYSATQAEMLISSIEFQNAFHDLEVAVLDWALSNWSRKAQAEGIIPPDSRLPANWRRECVKWQRPPKRAVNPVDEQTALNSGLKNGTILYRDQLGPDWKAKLAAFAEELEFCKAHNIPHLAYQTVSGGVVAPQNQNQEDK